MKTLRSYTFLSLLLCSFTASAQEGGIEVFAGETLFKSGFRLSTTQLFKEKNGLFRGSHKTSDPMNLRRREYRTVFGLDYGLRKDITLSALLPVVRRELRSSGVDTSATGLGDLALLGKYRVFNREGKARSFNVAVIGGLELPTGDTNEMSMGLRLAPSLQPGKGALSPFLATSITTGLGRARFDSTVFYKWNTEGSQQFKDGNFFSLSLSAAYRFLHYKYPGPTFGARLGLQWRHEGRAELAGSNVGSSGADELLLTPALSIHPIPQMDLNLGVRLPLTQHYNGTQLGRDLEFTLALGIRF